MMRNDDNSVKEKDDLQGIEFDESSGISEEDQKEILGEIDQIVTDNKIKVTPEVFQIKPQKKGFLFPTLVNVFSLVILAAGIVTLALLFHREETIMIEETSALSTAEGKLLRELQRETEEITLDGVKGTYVAALPAESAGGQAILGWVGFVDDHSWFVKLMGDAALAREQEEAFRAFLMSIRFSSSDGAGDGN